ncbi:MAG TPA: N-acetylmuramic acid 6-phosphate etherase [Flavitalea sp.]|nr:N-acetylmuramic acid 6-phosphate etherase [Flavitalea sp.]
MRITEQAGPYRNLEKMSVQQLLLHMNEEDQKVAGAVQKALPDIEKLVSEVGDRLLLGGRLFYLGAGTSGRLGVLDASEVPPTFGLPQGIVIGIIAGGEKAIRFPVENAEDDEEQGWLDLAEHGVNEKDIVIGIASSGTTPYVISALKKCQEQGITTGSIACNPGSPVSSVADFPVEVIAGPEFLTGSTRLKSGTAQKMVLNMISTVAMIIIGRVEDNRMVNMQLTNAKLIDRGTHMLMERSGITDYDEAKKLLLASGSVKKALIACSGTGSK